MNIRVLIYLIDSSIANYTYIVGYWDEPVCKLAHMYTAWVALHADHLYDKLPRGPSLFQRLSIVSEIYLKFNTVSYVKLMGS